MGEQSSTTFLDRTLGNLRRAWQTIAGGSVEVSAGTVTPDLGGGDAERVTEQMRACLETRGGEVSARARAAALGHTYLALNDIGRERFIRILAVTFDVDGEAVDKAVDALRGAKGIDDRRRAERNLRRALVAPNLRLLTQFNALPEGIKFLVDLRACLLTLLSTLAKDDPALQALNDSIKGLLTTWFDVDFLELRRITWDTASAALLEKLIAYEAVHAIEGWDDLKNRLDSDRRCFAFFHPRMPDEPLVFVEVALVNGLADNVQALLDENAPVLDPGKADTAIFYSIYNAQKGLAGISFGNFLIKRVVDSLAADFKGLTTFATLSPVPGFMKWLKGQLAEGEPDLLRSGEQKALQAAHDGPDGAESILISLLEAPEWHLDKTKTKALRRPLMRLCSRYLMEEKRPGRQGAKASFTAGFALDRVAHFHLRNGARMERLNWMADTSPKGLEQSGGMMVNYVYALDDIEANHEAYVSNRIVVASSGMRNRLKG